MTIILYFHLGGGEDRGGWAWWRLIVFWWNDSVADDNGVVEEEEGGGGIKARDDGGKSWAMTLLIGMNYLAGHFVSLYGTVDLPQNKFLVTFILFAPIVLGR